MIIDQLLDDKIIDAYSLKGEDLEIEWVDPLTLLVGCRFDLAAKLCYIRAYVTKNGYAWAKKLYCKHLEAFSDGRPFTEHEYKKDTNDYIKVFNELIDSISKSGVDAEKSVIPVGNGNSIMDGAHRVAISIYFGLRLPIVRLSGIKSEYGYNFFKERMLDGIYLDYMALEYLKWKDNVYSLCVWPIVGKSTKISLMEKLLSDRGEIIYKKKIYLNYNGLCNLMVEIYKEFEWIGKAETRFDGTIYKADLCYHPHSPTFYYIVEMDSLGQMKKMKDIIRRLFQVEKSSIHTTDTHTEALNVGYMLLSDCSIDYLNVGKPFADIGFYRKLNALRTGVDIHDLEAIALTGNSVFEMYGLKNGNGLEIAAGNEAARKKMEKLVGSDSFMEVTCIDQNPKKQQVIYDPRQYFRYADIKFLTVATLKKYSELSPDDIKLLDTIRSGNHRYRKKICEIQREYYRHYRNWKRMVIEKTYNFLERHNMLEFARKIWHFIRGK